MVGDAGTSFEARLDLGDRSGRPRELQHAVVRRIGLRQVNSAWLQSTVARAAPSGEGLPPLPPEEGPATGHPRRPWAATVGSAMTVWRGTFGPSTPRTKDPDAGGASCWAGAVQMAV